MLTRTIAWNGPLGQISAEMDRMFESWLPPSTLTRLQVPWRPSFPALNVTETADAVIVEAELPGIPREQLNLSVQNDELTIRGERKAPETTGQCLRHERWHGTFERTISLPTSIDPENVQATLTDGVLSVTLTKVAEARPRRIEVRQLPSGA